MSSTDFKKLRLKRSAPIAERETAEARYWKKFVKPVNHDLVAPPTHIDFCPVAPHNFLVTASTQVTMYSSRSNSAIRSFTRFGDIAHCGVFRHDGKLIAAGDGSGKVRLFDVDSRSALRVFKGHKAACQAVAWAPQGLQVLSCGDDKKVFLWDIPTQEKVQAFEGHGDYVRSAAAVPAAEGLWLTGGYDKVVKLWDARAGRGAQAAFPCASAVACLRPLPGARLFFAGAGAEVLAWDLARAPGGGGGGGGPVERMANHAGAVTALCLDGGGGRLLSAGLDGHVKVYDLRRYAVAAGLALRAPALALGLAPDGRRLVAGLTDNTVTIRQRLEEKPGAAAADGEALRGGSAAYFRRGHAAPAAPGDVDVAAAAARGPRLRPYERALKKFRYGEALDAGLRTRNPLVVAALLEELRQRQGLGIALSGRGEEALEPVLAFLNRYVAQPKYTPLLVEVCQKVLDVYGGVLGESEAIDELFLKLRAQVRAELRFQREAMGLRGALAAVGAAAQLRRAAAAAAGEGEADEDDEKEGLELEGLKDAARIAVKASS